MRLKCPHCDNKIELLDDSGSDRTLVCSGCGSVFGAPPDRPTITTPLGQGGRLGRFELLQAVGSGGFGTVYKARDPELDRVVALKVPRSGTLIGRDDRARFLREARSLARLQDPAIVPVYEVGEIGDLPYLASEFVEGLTVSETLQLVGRLTPKEAATLAAEVAAALQHAHERGLVHRDVKASNIMLGRDGRPRLMDFGLAKRDADEVSMTLKGQIIGTPAYMSPEQARADGSPVDARSDVYGLGVVLYQALSGEPPFRGSPRLLLHQILHEDPRPPRSLNDRIPRDLEAVVLKAMAKEPARRYGSAGELAADLRRFLAGEAVRARPVGAVEKLRRRCRRNPAGAGLVASVLGLLALIAVLAAAAAWRLRAADAAAQSLQVQLERDRATRRAEAHLPRARAHRQGAAPGWAAAAAAEVARAAGGGPPPDPALTVGLRSELAAALAAPALRPAGDLGLTLPNGTHAVALDPAFERLAWSDARGGITVRRVGSGAPDGPVFPGPGDPAWILSFSPDGRYLVAKHHRAGQVAPVRWRVWDLRRGRLAWELGPEHQGWAAAFHPDGRRIAVAERSGAIGVYELATGRPAGRLPGPGLAGALAFSPDGRRLALAGLGAAVAWVIDASTGATEATLPHGDTVFGVAWRPGDGRLLATACDDGEVRVWDTRPYRHLADLRGHTRGVYRLAFNASGTRLTSLGWDRMIRLWDPLVPRPIASATTPDDAPFVAFSPDDRRLGLVRDGARLGLLAVEPGPILRDFGARYVEIDAHRAADPGPDGRVIVVSSDDGTAFWRPDHPGPPVRWGLPDAGLAFFHPAGDALLVFRSGTLVLHPFVVPADPGRPPRLGPPRRVAEGLTARPFGDWNGLDRDGRFLALAERENDRVVVLDLRSPGGRAVLGPAEHPTDAAMSPDGRLVAVSSWKPGVPVTIWDRAGGRVVRTLPETQGDAWFSPDGRWLAIASTNDYLLRSARDWAPLRRWRREPPRTYPAALAFSPDGRLIALTPTPDRVRLVEAATGRDLIELAAPDPGAIVRLRFSRDGRRLAAACESHLAQVWDLDALRGRLRALGLDWSDPSPTPNDPVLASGPGRP